MLQAARNRLAGRISGERARRRIRSAVQEHAQGILQECERSAPAAWRHCGRRSEPGARRGDNLPDGRYGREADEAHGLLATERRVQGDLSKSKTVRHREVAGSHRPRTRDDDTLASDSQGDGARYEDRRCGVSGRQDKSHILLYSRRAGRLQGTDQGLRERVRDQGGDEADRRTARGGADWGPGVVWTGTVLHVVDCELQLSHNGRRADARHIFEPAKIGGTVLQAEVLFGLRAGCVYRRAEVAAKSERPIAGAGWGLLFGFDRRVAPDDEFQHAERSDGRQHCATGGQGERDSGYESAGTEARHDYRLGAEARG